MKAYFTAMLLVLIIGNIGAVDTESYQFIDYLRSLPGPGMPQVYQNGVVFTAPSSFSRVGISFAHENYSRVHWFRNLLIPRDAADLHVDGRLQRHIDPYIDSGIMFHLEMIPENVQNLDYRLVIDGLWTVDPLNPLIISGPSGVSASRFPLPPQAQREASLPSGLYRFNFNAQPGEIITVGGDFNNWDPFMYQLTEISPGIYSITLPFPPGRIQYVFYYRGTPVPDPLNPWRAYNREGRYVSEAFIN